MNMLLFIESMIRLGLLYILKPPFRINPTAVIFRSLAKVTASVVGADLDKMTPTPIFAALI